MKYIHTYIFLVVFVVAFLSYFLKTDLNGSPVYINFIVFRVTES